jgi:hypothetical protein
VGRSEVDLRDLPQHFWAMGLDQFARALFNVGRHTAAKLHAQRFAARLQPINECFPRQD